MFEISLARSITMFVVDFLKDQSPSASLKQSWEGPQVHHPCQVIQWPQLFAEILTTFLTSSVRKTKCILKYKTKFLIVNVWIYCWEELIIKHIQHFLWHFGHAHFYTDLLTYETLVWWYYLCWMILNLFTRGMPKS